MNENQKKEKEQSASIEKPLEPQLESLKYAEEISRDVLSEQLKSTETLLQGTTLIIGLAGIMIGVIFIWDLEIHKNLSFYFFCLGILGMIGAIVLSFISSYTKEYAYTYNPTRLWDYTAEDEIFIRKQVYSNIMKSFEINNKKIGQSMVFLRMAVFELGLGIISITIFYFTRLV